MQFIAREKPIINAVPFYTGLGDGVEVLCARSGDVSCADNDDGRCFTGPESCRYRMPMPYVITNSQMDVGHLTPGCYVELLPGGRKKVWDKYDFEFMYEPLNSSETHEEPTVTKDRLIAQILAAAKSNAPFLFCGNVVTSKGFKDSWRLQFAGAILIAGDTKTHDGVTAFYPLTVFNSTEELEGFLATELE